MKAAAFLLKEIEKQKAEFHWSQAAESYIKYLAIIPGTDMGARGEVLEWTALCRYYAAMQARTKAGFRHGIAMALTWETQARGCFDRLGPAGKARFMRCKAMEAYLKHWPSTSPSKRKQLLDESWRITKESLRQFETAAQYREYAETYNRLVFSVAIGQEYDWDSGTRARKCEEAIERGRKVIGIVRSTGNKEDLARTLVRTSLFLDVLSDNSSDARKLEDYRREGLELWEEAVRLSKDVAYVEASRPPQGFHRIMDHNQNLALRTEALKMAKDRRDNFAIGWIMDYLAKYTFYSAEGVEDQLESVKRHADALHFAEEAARHYRIIGFTSPIIGVLWAHSPYAEHFIQVATHEPDQEKRRLLNEKGLRCTQELLRLARKSEHPQVMHYASHVTSRAAVNQSKLETNKRRKKELLAVSLKHRLASVRAVEKIDPIVSWNLGSVIMNLAENYAKLAEVEEDSQKKKELLIESVSNYEKGMKSSTMFVESLERPENHILLVQLGLFHGKYGETFSQLHSVVGDEQYLRSAAREYIAAAECYKKIFRYSKEAEAYWKAAEIYDRLEEPSLSSENFALASKGYARLGRHAPHLKELGEDYARYLMAWNEIEIARSAHKRLQYNLAAKSYDAAARLHKHSKRWGFLAPYYLAWSRLESAEKLSKEGNQEDAILAFEKAKASFARSRTILKEQLALLDQPSERAMVTKLAEASQEEFCQARTILEEAVLKESAEDYDASSEKFGLASEKLRDISESAESDLDRKEAGFLSILCQAWQSSSRAELGGPIKFLEDARDLFAVARKMSPSQSADKLASAHEAFCKALIASRRFADTHDPVAHDEASRQFDLAAGLYLDSGFKTASAQTVARKLLLDAYEKLNHLSKEQDHLKRVELYRLAGALLNESANAFLKARQRKKREQALNLLEKADMESQLSSRLTEILNAASSPPGNIAFHTPLRGLEKAVGLERFERSDIDARVVGVTKNSGASGHVEVAIEILNIGERPVRLVRLDESVPDGAELVEHSGTTLQGRSLMLGQTRVAPTNTATIRLVISPKTGGLLRITPKIIFLDETDQERERFMEPIIAPSSRILEFLATSFVKDSTGRRLAPAYCGWRTLMEIVHELRIPRSHVYGEARYGRMFGKQLESLVKSSLVEYRIFPGERGRGGDITKVRVQLNNRDIREYLEELVPGLAVSDPIGERAVKPEDQKNAPQITVPQ